MAGSWQLRVGSKLLETQITKAFSIKIEQEETFINDRLV
jgi:hypothetical protein